EPGPLVRNAFDKDKGRVRDAARATTPTPKTASFAGRSRLIKRRYNQNPEAPFLDKQTGNGRALSTTSGAGNKCPRRVPNLLSHVRLGRDKFRREPRKQPYQIVRHQDLPITIFT